MLLAICFFWICRRCLQFYPCFRDQFCLCSMCLFFFFSFELLITVLWCFQKCFFYYFWFKVFLVRLLFACYIQIFGSRSYISFWFKKVFGYWWIDLYTSQCAKHALVLSRSYVWECHKFCYVYFFICWNHTEFDALRLSIPIFGLVVWWVFRS